MSMAERKIKSVNFWSCVEVLPQRDPQYPSFKRSGSVNCLRSEGLWLSVFVAQDKLHSLDLELLSLHRSRKDLRGLLSTSRLGTTR